MRGSRRKRDAVIRAFIDANVIMSFWTLDVILTLADESLLEPKWSAEVLQEFRRTCNELRRADGAEHIIANINTAFPNALVEGWEWCAEYVVLPDIDDRHVAAAAIVSECDYIVTFNLRDFPSNEMAKLGFEALHPDELVMKLVALDPESVLASMRRLVADKKRPPRTMAEEIAGLRRCRICKFADWLERQTSAQ